MEAALLRMLTHWLTPLLSDQVYSVSKRQRGVSTKMEMESLQSIEKIKFVYMYAYMP